MPGTSMKPALGPRKRSRLAGGTVCAHLQQVRALNLVDVDNS
jgi:hypothetical protein